MPVWRHDTQHNDTQYNDTQHNNKILASQHNYTQQNGTCHLIPVMMSVSDIMLNVAFIYCYAECSYAEHCGAITLSIEIFRKKCETQHNYTQHNDK